MKLKLIFLLVIGVLSLFSFQNFTQSHLYEYYLQNRPFPPQPKIIRDVHLRENSKYTTPVISAFRTSTDGRIAISVQKQLPSLYLFRPEQQKVPVLQDSAGVKLLASNKPFTFGKKFKETVGTGHKTICDGTQIGKPGNPKSCGPNNQDDCYDLTLISYKIENSSKNFQLYGLPFRVRVSNPKTKDAQISEISEGEIVAGPVFKSGIQIMFEPITTADGRLLVARFGNSNLKWTPSNGGQDKTTITDISYFYGSTADRKNTNPCDVRQWTKTYPITHAPFHEDLRKTYAFARYPFRDPTGKVVPDGAEFLATYPWIDKAGKNLMFATYKNELYRFNKATNTVFTEYPTKCLENVPCKHPTTREEIADIEKQGTIKSFGFIGLWTHGKMITFDGASNNTEYGLGESDDLQRQLKLYNSDKWIRVGTGRIAASGNWEDGSAENTSFIESFENIFNYNDNLKPLKIGDVVWTLNSGRTSEDVVFDDYINPHTLIASDMNASFEMRPTSTLNVRYYDEATETTPIRLQNAATAPASFLKIPKYGEVSGTARIEPVAMGGIRGKGFYIFKDTRIDYAIENQRSDLKSWYTGLFVDFRENLDGQLLRYPDGSAVVAGKDRNLDFLSPDGTVEKQILLPENLKTRKWLHIAIQNIEEQSVEIFVDGELYDRWNTSYFRIKGGTLTVGNFSKKYPVFKGWIDEIRVIAGNLNSEYKCNIARGTIVQSNGQASGQINYLFQSRIKSLLGTSNDQSTQYECLVSRGRDEYNRRNIPKNKKMVRDLILVPEGLPLAGKERPSSINNNFCLGCHVTTEYDAYRTNSLNLSALVSTPGVLAEHDSRRQPMQPPRSLHGTVPPKMFKGAFPQNFLIHKEGGGTLIDRWLN